MRYFATDLVKFDTSNVIVKAKRVILEAEDVTDAREQAKFLAHHEWVLFAQEEISEGKAEEIVKREDDALANAGYGLI